MDDLLVPGRVSVEQVLLTPDQEASYEKRNPHDPQNQKDTERQHCTVMCCLPTFNG